MADLSWAGTEAASSHTYEVFEMADDIYIQAYRRGNVEAVNALLKRQYPDDEERLRVLEMFDDSGLWSIGWQPEHGGSAEVRAYLGG